jgi:hypothetical protein
MGGGGADHAPTTGAHTHDDQAHPHDHSQLPPGAEAPVTWRSLLAQGISGC